MFRKVILALVCSVVMASGEALHIGAVKGMLDHAKKTVNQVDVKTLKSMIDRHEKFYLVDLRGKTYLERGEIYTTNLLRIERGYLEFKIEKEVPDKNARIVLYCCSGVRSILAAESLMKMGYKNVSSLKGGITEWIDKDFPLDVTFGEVVTKH